MEAWQASSGLLVREERTSSALLLDPQLQAVQGMASACRSVEGQREGQGYQVGRWKPDTVECWSQSRWTRGKGLQKGWRSHSVRRTSEWCVEDSAETAEGSNNHCTCWAQGAPDRGWGTVGHTEEETGPGLQMKTSPDFTSQILFLCLWMSFLLMPKSFYDYSVSLQKSFSCPLQIFDMWPTDTDECL